VESAGDLGRALEPNLSPEDRQLILDAMLEVTSHEQGTARRVHFRRLARRRQDRHGAEPWADRRLVRRLCPVEDPKIVVGCVVEGGGHGADAAAPLVREMMAAHFNPAQTPVAEGSIVPEPASPEAG